MKKLYFLFCLLLGWMSFGSVSAQTVSGKLVDETGQPLPFANVVLLSLPDSAFVSGTISGEDGSFTLEATSGNQIVKISSIGYQAVYKPVSPANIGIVQLVSDAQMLGEVVVKGNLPITRIKGDAMVTGVVGTALEKAGTAEQMLDKIPNVTSKDGEINVFGRGTPEIYVNGRKLLDNSELDRLSAENIKSVEVVNNPGARYGAEVTSVIRIITKKAEGEGFGFDNRAMFQYNRDWSALEQLNFNYRKDGWDLSGMLYGSRMYGWISKELVQDTYLQEHWQQKSTTFNDWTSRNFNARLAVNYTINKNSALGIRYDYHKTPYSKSLMEANTDVYRDGTLSEKTYSPNIIDNGSEYHQVNAYYNGKIKEWSIDLNLDGFWDKSDKASYLDEKTELADGRDDNRYVSIFNDIDNTLYAARLILSRPIWGGELSFGGEYTYTNRRNINLNPEGIVSDDDCRIRENMGAAFAEYSRKFGSVQALAGLRYEYNASDYFEKGVRVDEQSKNFSNLFPTLSIAFPINRVNFQLAYRTDIARPSYWDLRSSVLLINKYTYETGNPLLDPKFTHNLTLGTTYRWLQLSVGYNRVKNDILNVTSLYDENDPTIMLMSLANAEAYDKIFAGVTLSPTIGIWKPQWRFQLNKQWYDIQTPQGNLSLDNPMGTIIWNNNLSLPLGFMLDADFMYTSKGDMKNGRFLKPSWRMDMALQKSLLNDRLNIRLDATNLFNSYKRDFMMYVSNMQTMHMTEEPNNCTVRLTVRYKFNTAKSKYKGTGAGDSQKSKYKGTGAGDSQKSRM